ncbi:MAG: hypothetical protein ACT443_00405 [Gemmatimonadota bacterium]
MSFSAVIDERQQPSLRQTLGRLLQSACVADFAVAHLRLAGLDLVESEVARLDCCRIMLGQLDAAALFDSPEPGQPRLGMLSDFARSGRLEIRTAPHHVWNPDFSIFGGLPGEASAVLLGAHYFGRPYPLFGLAFTCVLTQPAAIRTCSRRFEELWQAGYDVLPVVLDTLDRAGG